MKRCIVLGKPNVGKTVFVLNFAEYLGLHTLEITFEEAAGKRRARAYSPDAALVELTSPDPHTTRALQSVAVEVPAGKSVKRFSIVDTSGLIDGIHSELDVRRAMAQTLATVRTAHLILHMVDASRVGAVGAVEALGEVDYQVAQFAQMRGGYALLANKIDLPGADRGLAHIRSEFVGLPIFAVSALYKQGFKEVKRFVWRRI